MTKELLKKIAAPFSPLYYLGKAIKTFGHNIKGLHKTKKEFRKFEASASQTSKRFRLSWKERMPYFDDNTAQTPFDSHYIYHPAWAARILASNKPELHIDISSTLHFCSLISAFIQVKFYDYRPANLNLSGLSAERGDLSGLPFETNSIRSISCMHTVEHIGLGRYGDPIDYDGDIKAISELKRVTTPGGDILFVVPVGKPIIRFNGHRIYSFEQIITYFSGCKLMDFSLVKDDRGFINNADPALVKEQEYGCGCFWFKKNEQ